MTNTETDDVAAVLEKITWTSPRTDILRRTIR